MQLLYRKYNTYKRSICAMFCFIVTGQCIMKEFYVPAVILAIIGFYFLHREMQFCKLMGEIEALQMSDGLINAKRKALKDAIMNGGPCK